MELDVAGARTFVYTGGRAWSQDGASRTVVFVHGAEQDHSCWNLQARWFAHHGFQVLAPDLPGHGRSGGTPLASVEAMADWLAALLDAAAVAQADVVGHSMGSLVALEAAIRHAGRVRRVALLGSSLPMPVSEPLLDAARNAEPKAVAMINAFSYSSTAQMGGSPVPGMWMLGVNRRLMERQPRGVFGVDMSACNAYARPVDSLGAITQPLLLIAGQQDRMTPARASATIAAAVPGAKLVVIPGSGHALMAERPDAVLDELRAFLTV